MLQQTSPSFDRQSLSVLQSVNAFAGASQIICEEVSEASSHACPTSVLHMESSVQKRGHSAAPVHTMPPDP
jgi:hypothetical protein